VPFTMVSGALRAEDINLSIKCRYSIRILRFELLILKDAFLMVIFAFVFVVPSKHRRSCCQSSTDAGCWSVVTAHHFKLDLTSPSASRWPEQGSYTTDPASIEASLMNTVFRNLPRSHCGIVPN
jgi:hypothetical protein